MFKLTVVIKDIFADARDASTRVQRQEEGDGKYVAIDVNII